MEQCRPFHVNISRANVANGLRSTGADGKYAVLVKMLRAELAGTCTPNTKGGFHRTALKDTLLGVDVDVVRGGMWGAELPVSAPF